jgi:hypothetical protein
MFNFSFLITCVNIIRTLGLPMDVLGVKSEN